MTRWLKAAQSAQLTTDETDKTDETPSPQGVQVRNPQGNDVLSVMSVLSVGQTGELDGAPTNSPRGDLSPRLLTGNNSRSPSSTATSPSAGYRSHENSLQGPVPQDRLFCGKCWQYQDRDTALRLALAQVLDDAGVPISAGQRVGNEALRRREGMSSAGQALNQTQREALTRAALRTVGTDASRATPEVLAETSRRIGSVFDDVARGVDVTPEPSAVTALAQANETYKQLAPKTAQAPIVGEIVKRMTSAFRAGQTIPASTVNSWRSNLSKLTTSSDGATMQPRSTGFFQNLGQAFNGMLGPNDPSQMTYEQAKRRSALAGLLAQRVMTQQPQNWGQGLSAMTGAFVARRMGETADAALTAGREQAASRVGALFQNGQAPGAPMMPGGQSQPQRVWPGEVRPMFGTGFGGWGRP